MREILFRGKRVDNGEWAESPYPYGTMSSGVVQHDFIFQTVGQYTGVNDIDGVRIFEGDIVKNIVTDLICAVAQDNYYAGFVIKDSNNLFSLSKASGRAQKVVGNIHDNPELLGGAQ